MSERRYAKCPACKRQIAVRRSGVLWLHYASRAARYYCLGGRKPIYWERGVPNCAPASRASGEGDPEATR